jgi:hypothetical protein
MRFTSKVVFIALLTAFAATAQVPIGISRFIDPWQTIFPLQQNIQGDLTMYTAWAANSMLPLFPDPAGLPILGTANDATVGACSGNIELAQISKLPGIGATPTSGNTLLTPYPNCMSSYGLSPGAINYPAGWNGNLTSGDGHSDGSWKGTVLAFRNNRLLAPFYRQTPTGSSWGDSSMVMSPDAGQTWIDYGRYNGYTVTAASCTGTTVTLTAVNALPAGQKIYVHDVGTVYDGKHTLATASGSQVTYAVSGCPGAAGSTGYFGILSADGSAPLGPTSGAYDMMWPVSGGHNPMLMQSIISYGQDGNYPAGIEAACDPTVYVCGLAYDRLSGLKTILYRVPVGKEMDKSQYQWYTCTGYSPYWGVQDTVCDGNNGANWTSTLSGATTILYDFYSSGITPGVMLMMRYMPTHKAYLTANIQNTTVSRYTFYWAPHPWGPFYPVTSSDCYEQDANYPHGCVPSFALMDYGENVISTTPPRTQVRIAAKSDETSQGTVAFWTVEAAAGRVPFTGAARRADYMGVSGQLGMGHRFVSGNEANAISRRGLGYSLDWWTDVWDHGGMTCCGADTRPWFRDLMSGGAKYFAGWDTDGGDHRGLGHSVFRSDGLYIPSGYGPRLDSNFTDTTWSANSSWTFITAFTLASLSNTPRLMYTGTPPASPYPLSSMSIVSGLVSPGDLCLAFSEAAYQTTFCLPGSTLTTNTWYFLTLSAEAQGSGYPIYRIYLGTGGTITEYGGVDLSTSGDGSSGGNVTKHCYASTPSGNHCTAAPAITGTVSSIGGGNGGSLNGTLGEAGLYLGVVPSHVIREIYRTLRTDWARVGRGAL